MKTYVAKPGEVAKTWYLVDATDHVVGRLAARLAMTLMGKDKPQYTAHVDTGDFVVVVNAEKVRFTGKKWQDKMYKRYTGYPGGLRQEPAGHLLKRKPTMILREAIRRMLPKNKLGRRMLSKLKLYAGPDHPHQAQQPVPMDLGTG